MERTIVAQFESRRQAELAVERLVQEHGIARTVVFTTRARRGQLLRRESGGR